MWSRSASTLLVSSGSHGKFLSRLDLDVQGRRDQGLHLPADPGVLRRHHARPGHGRSWWKSCASRTRLIWRRWPGIRHDKSGLLYRRGNFNGTWDDLICQALLEERDAEISLSPGFRWGSTLLPGQPITYDDIYNQTAITYPNAYRMEMTGAQLKADPGRRGRQPVQPRPVLPAGRRHGARRRHGLHHRHQRAHGQPHLRHDAAEVRQAHRGGEHAMSCPAGRR